MHVSLCTPHLACLSETLLEMSTTSPIRTCFRVSLSWDFFLPSSLCPFLSFFVFLEPYPRHIEVSRLEVESELQLLAYATATATTDQSLVCDLLHTPQQHWVLNPLSEARDQSCILMDASLICFPLSQERNSISSKSYGSFVFLILKLGAAFPLIPFQLRRLTSTLM